MKLSSLFLIITLIFYSCNNDDQSSKNAIQNKITAPLNLELSVYNSLFVFAKLSRDSLYCVEGEKLFHVYKEEYSKSYKDYESFLNIVSKGDIMISPKKFNENDVIKFSIDSDVKKQYLKKQSISSFLESYCNRYREKKLVVKNEYSKNRSQVFTILYYAFINHYKVSQSDYVGNYIIRR